MFFGLTSVSLVFSVYLIVTADNLFVYIVAISFTALSLISGVFNIISSYSYFRSYFYDEYLEKIKKGLKPMGSYPTVAVVISTYNENPEMVAKNLARLQYLKYDKSKLRFYVLDDSTDPKIVGAMEEISRRNSAVFMHRNERKDFKAGALNSMLKKSSEEYLAFFDADEYLTNENFLTDLLPYFQDSKVSFVQTEKRVAKGTFFSDTVDLFDALFFKLIQPSRVLNGTGIFAGSCAIIRRSALDEIGGFPPYITEDTFFSFESDVHNFKGLHVPQVYALGKPMGSFTELAHQQWRYNYGDTQFLIYFLKHRKLSKKGTLSALSKIDYTAHGFGLNYLSSILILFTVVSMLIVISAAPFAFASIKQVFTPPYTVLNLELLGISAFLLSIFIPVALTKAYFGSYSKGVMMFVLNFALSFVRLKGALAAILSTTPRWPKGAAPAQKVNRFFFALRRAGFELVFSGLLFISSFVAFLVYNISGALWLLWYGILYSSAFFFFARYS
ncbi:MAG: glycosyltransferase [Candidatus Micrarchaeota archaeon]|nr:glycosyltransferase [Candidatus Micrarchaeota archaeon]